MPIRPIVISDLPALKSLIDATGLFPSELLDGMTAGCFDGRAPDDLWMTVDQDGPMAVASIAPERMTVGTWNVLLIAVHPDRQGQGVGTALMQEIKRGLTAQGGRLLLVETSGLPEFEPTRHFYRRLGYEQEARIRDFYQNGEDKIIYRKAL